MTMLGPFVEERIFYWLSICVMMHDDNVCYNVGRWLFGICCIMR
jgi:hypothetical protein